MILLNNMPEGEKRSKYVFILGSVISGLGKGIVTVSTGKNLQARGIKVQVVKIDPYLNIDAGTMNPTEHGECFVTTDGGELDVDFGHYERFLGIEVSKHQNITTGKVYFNVIQKERQGKYLGHTVQVVPHIINEIIEQIESQERKYQADVMLIEVGGTIGDIESFPFLEALRQFQRNRDDVDVCTILLSYVPFPDHLSEHKTKPAQHSVRELRAAGITPNIIIGRSDVPLDTKTIQKIANFCDVSEQAVFDLPDLKNVFEAPILLDQQGFGDLVVKILNVDAHQANFDDLNMLLNDRLVNLQHKIIIGVPGKYTALIDSYISVNEALKHAAWHENCDIELRLIDTEQLEQDSDAIHVLDEVDGILVPGGFGDRGVEGKIRAIEYARTHNKPFLGICLGFQLAIVEYARHVLGHSDAHSTEMNPNTTYPIIDLLPEQKQIQNMGGTMRLGAYEITLTADSLLAELYDTTTIYERHRHRYEVNPALLSDISGNMRITGFWNDLAEAFQLDNHKYFVGTQYHPEFKSTPWKPSPPYIGLIRACASKK